MAGEKTYAELKAQIDAGIKVNGNREITPPIHNAIETNIANSSLNKKDGGIIESVSSYLTEITLTDRKQIAYKGYVDDQIATLDDYLHQGLNTLDQNLGFEMDGFLVQFKQAASVVASISSTGRIDAKLAYDINGNEILTYASSNIGIGPGATGGSSGSGNIFIGPAAGEFSAGTGNIGIGDHSIAGNSASNVLSFGAYAAYNNAISNIIAMGPNYGTLYLRGITNFDSSLMPFTIRNAHVLAGTVDGSSELSILRLSQAPGRGDGRPGKVAVQKAIPGTPGTSTLQTLSDWWIFDEDGTFRVNGDIEFVDNAFGGVYTDRATADKYRIYVDSGIISLELV